MADSPEEYPFKPILIPVQQSQVFPMNTRLLYAAIIFALFSIVSASAAQQGQDAIAKCDRLAASQLDPMRPPSVPGVPFDQVDGAAAVKACTEAFTKNPGNARIEFELARALERAGAPPDRTAALLREASDRGSLVAAHNLANALSIGKGVPKDEAEATRLYRKAAEGGVSLSMGVYAGRLESGVGVEKNETESFIWYSKVAEAGDIESMQKLVGAYAYGRLGVGQNDMEARRWAERAAASGDKSSAMLLNDFRNLSALSASEVTSIQTSLTASKCFFGLIDGKPSFSLQVGITECPDQRPQLRIETGTHLAPIRSIGVDARCSLAATASEDKTIRLWSLPEGKLLRTLRVPIGAGRGGKVVAVAVSPDGRFIAAGGYDAGGEVAPSNSVNIFDVASGAVIARVGPFMDSVDGKPVYHLAFSPDGRWLAATLWGGVRMIETAGWRMIAAEDYGFYNGGAKFGLDGRLYTSSDDGKIRRYAPGPGFALEATIATRGKKPRSLAIDPRGEQLAVGFEDTQTVDYYDTKTLAFRGAADSGRVGSDQALSRVAWRADGQVLIAGGIGTDVPFILFDRKGQRLSGSPPIKAEGVRAEFQPCGAGFVVANLHPAAFGLLEPLGHARFWRTSVAADMAEKRGAAFMISADAKSVRFGLEQSDKNPVVFDTVRASLSANGGPSAGFSAPLVSGLPVTDWIGAVPRLNGTSISIPDGDISHSLAIQPDRSGFVIGGTWNLYSFDRKGARRWAQPNPAIALGVNPSADGRIVVAAYDDGTIRWHRWSDGQELLALFVNKETKAWVAWTPTGYYSASPSGEDMIGWHVNHGWNQAADFFPASRFHDQFARPDIVERVLDTLDEGEAVKQANAARGGRAPETGSIIDHLPPVVSILAPADGATVGDEARIDYLIRSPSGLDVNSVEVLIDGRPVPAGRGLGRLDEKGLLKQCLMDTRGLGRVEGALQGCRGSLMVNLPPGASEVGVFARAGGQTSEVTKIRLTRASAPTTTELLKPKLYALVVGISNYQNKDYALSFPAKDAGDFSTALQNQRDGLYSEVETKTLMNEKATAAAIREGLDWLTHNVTSRDVGLIYLAGHGMLDERDRFYFIAADSDAARLRSTAVPRDDINDALDAVAGKALLFLDACHAGGIAGATKRRDIDINTVVNDFTRGERGVVVFAASTGRQVSQESATWNNGAFTKAVVEGLGLPGAKALATYGGDGKITTSGLDLYVTERVKKLTGGEQSPVMIRPPTVPDFPFAVAR